MAVYRIYLVDGARQELRADRCRHDGARYVFERENTSGGWRVVHEVDVADVAQLQDGVAAADHPSHSWLVRPATLTAREDARNSPGRRGDPS